MHTRACTHTHLRMHKPQHANAHSHTCTTRMQARHTYTCTHNTHANTVVGVGVDKGSYACGIFEQLNDNVCLNGFWALWANPDSMGYTIRALQQLQNELLRNYSDCMRYKLIYARIISEGGDRPPKGGCFSNVHWAWAPVFATVKYGSKWYYLQQLLQMWGHMLNCPRHEPHFLPRILHTRSPTCTNLECFKWYRVIIRKKLINKNKENGWVVGVLASEPFSHGNHHIRVYMYHVCLIQSISARKATHIKPGTCSGSS